LKQFVYELLTSKKLNKLIKMPFDEKTYELVTDYLEEHLKRECERMVDDLENTVHKPELILFKFERTYELYHSVLSFFLERGLYKRVRKGVIFLNVRLELLSWDTMNSWSLLTIRSRFSGNLTKRIT